MLVVFVKVMEMVVQSLVRLRAKLLLVVPDPVETALLDLHPRVDHKLMEQLATEVDRGEFFSDGQPVGVEFSLGYRRSTLGSSRFLQVWVPTEIAGRKEDRVRQRVASLVDGLDRFQSSSLLVNRYASLDRKLLIYSDVDNSHFADCWRIVASQVQVF